jgi:rare lipoprotein A (peptidoglycan hydrolase)
MLTLVAALEVLVTLLGPAPVATESGLAAIYGQPGDRLAGGPLACTGKPLRTDELVCAHRTLPCGTSLLVQSLRSQHLATCQVLDRGPYGARLPSGRFVIKTRPEGRGKWRGVLDLSPAVASMLGVQTSEPVRIIYLRPDRRQPKKSRAALGHPPRLPTPLPAARPQAVVAPPNRPQLPLSDDRLRTARARPVA